MTALVNTEQINELSAFFLTRDPWRTWTPTVTQSGSVTVTVTYARYVVLAQTVIVQARLAVTGSGTGGNDIVIAGIPAAIAPANYDAGSGVAVVGTAVVLDNGTGFYQGALVAVGANDLRIQCHGETDRLGTGPSFALASGDAISFQGCWER